MIDWAVPAADPGEHCRVLAGLRSLAERAQNPSCVVAGAERTGNRDAGFEDGDLLVAVTADIDGREFGRRAWTWFTARLHVANSGRVMPELEIEYPVTVHVTGSDGIEHRYAVPGRQEPWAYSASEEADSLLQQIALRAIVCEFARDAARDRAWDPTAPLGIAAPNGEQEQ